MEQVEEVAATGVEGDRDVTTRTTRTIITRTTYGGGDGEPSLAGLVLFQFVRQLNFSREVSYIKVLLFICQLFLFVNESFFQYHR